MGLAMLIAVLLGDALMVPGALMVLLHSQPQTYGRQSRRRWLRLVVANRTVIELSTGSEWERHGDIGPSRSVRLDPPDSQSA